MPDSVFAKHCHLWQEPELWAWHLWKWFYSMSYLLVPLNQGFCWRKKEVDEECHTTWKVVNLLFLGSLSLSYYTSVRSLKKQHIYWSCPGKKCVFSNKPNIYTPHLHFFPLCPVETVETALMMAFAFYLTNPMCGLLAGCSHPLHSSRKFENEMISEIHFKQLWSLWTVTLYSFRVICQSYGFESIIAPHSEDEKNLSLLRAVRDLRWL